MKLDQEIAVALVLSVMLGNSVVSFPRCSDDNLFDEDSQRCFQPGSTGPCGSLMTFSPRKNDPSLGVCGCIIDPRQVNVYDQNSKKCYPVYSQGPCKPGRWIVLKVGIHPRPSCEVNPCSRTSTKTWVLLSDGKCARLGDRSACDSGQTVVLLNGTMPGCGTDITVRTINPLDVNPCGKNTVRSLDGGCHPPITIA